VLQGGALRISGPSGSSSTVTFDPGYPMLDGSDIVLAATFTGQDGNFEWTRREVLTSAGVVVDKEDQDLGRKVAGMVWTLDTRLLVG